MCVQIWGIQGAAGHRAGPLPPRWSVRGLLGERDDSTGIVRPEGVNQTRAGQTAWAARSSEGRGVEDMKESTAPLKEPVTVSQWLGHMWIEARG